MIQSSGQDAGTAKAQGTSYGWITHVVLACVGGVALAGMFIGFYDSVAPDGQPDYTTDPNAGEVDRGTTPQAVKYADMKDARFGPNASWKTLWPQTEDDSTQFYGSAPADAPSREADIARRAQRRAFDGAPPVVPHPINQQNAASCMVCHEQGMKVGQVIAPKMSHEHYANCTQCHAESINRALPPTTGPRAEANLFKGRSAPGPGERAWPGAPPIIPHTTWMRESCTSCHGSLADKGLRTSHPWRGNCVQCHALSAELDQRHPFSTDRPPLAVPPEIKE